MKKRLLSLLLVACMLLSMVPVFSTVAVAADSSAEEETPYDYSKLYVQNGLKLLYTAYAGHSTVDLANNKWVDASGNGNDATFVNAAASSTGPAINWEANRNGKNGVGYDMLGGSYDGSTWTKTANYNMEAAVQLNLPVSVLTALNDGAYTLDYVVEWHNVLYYKADGSLSTHADTYTGGGYWAGKPVERIGSLWHMACRGSNLGFGGTAYGHGRWSFAGTEWYGGQYNNSQLYNETTFMTTKETIARQTIARTRTDNFEYDIYAFYTYNEETSAWDTYAGAASVESWKKYSTTALPVEGVTYKMTSKQETLDNTNTKILVITYNVDGVETTLIDTIHANVIPNMEGLVGKEFRMVEEKRTTTKIGMTLARNGAVVKNGNGAYCSGTYYTDWLASSSSASKAGYANKSMNYYVADAVGNQFFLFASAPCTVYSVRFYDRPLEEHEVQQNHFADLCAYYKLDLGDFLSYSADVQKMVYAAFENYEIGEGDYDEVKLALQVYMNLVAASGTYDYTSLYHKDGLVALYTSFINDKNVNLSTGVWANSVAGGASARLSNPTKWDRNGFGATGFSQQKVTGALSNNTVFFELPYEYITGDSYTIDTFVNIRRHIDANGTFLGNTSTQGVSRHTGTYVFRLDSFNLMGPVAANGQFRVLYSNYTVDVLGGMKDPLENKLNIYANAAEISPVEIRTYYYAPMSNGSKYDDRKFDLVNNSLTGPQYVGPFAITKSTASGVSTFKLYNEVGSVQASYKVEDMQKAKGTTVTYNDGTQDVTVNKPAGISVSNSFLFGDYPVYIYAVRVYNDLLTEAEKLQNYFADVAAFYGLDMTEFEKASDEVKQKVYAGVGKAFMSLTHQNDDLVLYAEEREAAQASLDAFFTSHLVNEYDLLYVGMDGSETANGGRLTMYLSAMAGTNSAIPGIGTWYDKISGYDATFVSSKSVIWAMRGENGVGYDMLGGSLKEDGTYNTSSDYSFGNEVTLTLDLEALKALSDGGYNLDAVAEYHSLLWYDQNGILQSGAYNNNKLGSYTTYSEWIGNLKNIYNRADVKQDLLARQVRWYTAPGGTMWGSGPYYFNSQLHDEQSRLGGGISTYSFVRTLTENEEFDTWIFTYEDGTTVAVGKDKLTSYSADNTESFLLNETEYQIKAATRVTEDSNGNEIEHSYYEIFVGDTKVATNLYYKYKYLVGGGLATVVCDEMFNSLKEGTVTVTEGKTATDIYTIALNEDFANVKFGTYYSNSILTTSTDNSRADYANNSLNGYVKDSEATKFEMFHRAPCSIYGIRLYDAPLTDAENAQNHFADLCAYYLVDIAGFANATADAKTAAYAAVAELKLLAEGDAEYVATKAKVQAAVDNAKATEFEAGTVLPATVEGVADRVVAVWTNGSAKYLPGTVLAEAATLTPVLVAKGETVNGASVNVANGGLRFKATFSASDYYNLGKVMGNENAVLSMVIAPEVLVEKVANGVFTKEELGADNYVEVAINGYYDLEGDTYTFAAGLSELSVATKANNLSFAAVLCLTVKVGKETYEIYGDYNADCNRSGLEVLTPYIEDVIAGEESVAEDLKDDLYNLYVGFATHDTALADSLETALGLK